MFKLSYIFKFLHQVSLRSLFPRRSDKFYDESSEVLVVVQISKLPK